MRHRIPAFNLSQRLIFKSIDALLDTRISPTHSVLEQRQMRRGFGFLSARGTISSNALYAYSCHFISDVFSLHHTTFSFLGLI
jgi:hypothetical protein